MVLSTWSNISIEEVAEASGSGLRWFQLYIFKHRQLTKELVLRAEKAGYKALVITVDLPIVGKRLADERNHFELPKHLSLPNFSDAIPRSLVTMGTNEHGSMLLRYSSEIADSSITWDTIDWLRGVTKLPIILKGILTAEDTEEAIKHNIQGILVSNHGGRQLDGVPATVSIRKGNELHVAPTDTFVLVHTHTPYRLMLCLRL